MTEKSIFAYNLFLSLNISDFIFYVKIVTPLKTMMDAHYDAHYDVLGWKCFPSWKIFVSFCQVISESLYESQSNHS